MKRYIKGKESILFIKYNDIWCPISCEVSSGISEQTQMTPTTTRANQGWATSKPTEQSYTIDLQGQVVKEGISSILSFNKLRKMKRDRTLFEWQRKTLKGWYIDSGFGHFSNIADTNDAGEFMTFSATIEGFGEPIESTDKVSVLIDEKSRVIINEDDKLIKSK